MVSTVYGGLAQSIRDQENGPAQAGCFHVGYVGLNATAMGMLLATLADDNARVVPAVILWTAVCGAASVSYWAWVL
jgi:hypothetical protein